MDEEIPNLSGQLLVAHPHLRDPNFRRTILFLSLHEQENGAFGVVINRPAEQTLRDLLPDPVSEFVGQIPVFSGGPVGSDEVMLVGYSWEADGITVQSHLSLDQAGEFAEKREGILRAYRGYAGWTRGQLESELMQNSWFVHPPKKEILNEPDDAWFKTVSSLGPIYRLLALAPDDPELN